MEGEVIVGIDLGTTNSAVGIVDSGFPYLFADADGHRTMPSVVWFGDDGRVEVGRKASDCHQSSRSGTLVRSVKSQMGTGGNALPSGQTPESVSALILSKLKEVAESRVGHDVTKAVITVPAHFNDAQRKATLAAGEMAGLKVERLVSEPTAAALCYGLDKLEEESKVAVFDWGGGTFDISILQLKEGVFEVLATAGDTSLGGDDFDLALAKEAAGERWEKMPEAEQGALIVAAEDLKKRLSEEQSAAFPEELSLSKYKFSRLDLNRLGFSLLTRTKQCSRRAMSDAGVHSPRELNRVILVGATTRMPLVREAVTEIFEQEPDFSQHPDEAIALGASIQAGILSGAVSDVVLLDVTPLSLGLETYGGLMNVLIPRNTTIPCRAGEMFTNASAEQTAIAIRVLQGEREMARDNWELGQFTLAFAKQPKGQMRIGVQFALDENGVLEVLARDTTTGEDTVVQIESAAVDVGDEEVGKMVDESIDFAFEDMEERIFTEARLKAEELLPAVDEAMAQVGSELGEAERTGIETAAERVKGCLMKNDANELKQAVQELDSATEAMAARLVEKAMEAQLGLG